MKPSAPSIDTNGSGREDVEEGDGRIGVGELVRDAERKEKKRKNIG